MSKQSWPELLKSSKKTSLVKDGLRKVHYIFTDGKEMAEEYDLQTNGLILRQWRHNTSLGAQGPWQIEVGEPHVPTTVAILESEEGIKENRVNPTCSRKDTRTAFQWRIRNLPYQKEVFSVSVEPAERCCVVRTSNKKYYKKFDIPDLDRCRLPLEQSALSFAHANNTLIVVYKKPKEILSLEQELMKELKMLKGDGDGDVDCKTQ